MERPALQRLLTDIDAGEIDVVVSYKLDRLSRSLLDFARMMERFEARGVAFVAVTQQFNSATSMGRLVLNVLLSFAQFERELVAERTRDKIAAARRKGKWIGGVPLLGFDVDPMTRRRTVNVAEAKQVRTMFTLYLEHDGLIRVVQELERRGWKTKRWTTRKGHIRGGKPFTKTALRQLLTNVVYTGKLRYRDEVHDGEHEAIVEPEQWQRVQELLHVHRPRSAAGARARRRRCRPAWWRLWSLLTCGKTAWLMMTGTRWPRSNKASACGLCSSAPDSTAARRC
jgi:site-specific DNA recombinase